MENLSEKNLTCGRRDISFHCGCMKVVTSYSTHWFWQFILQVRSMPKADEDLGNIWTAKENAALIVNNQHYHKRKHFSGQKIIFVSTCSKNSISVKLRQFILMVSQQFE